LEEISPEGIRAMVDAGTIAVSLIEINNNILNINGI
jgi:hypothetical protein